MKTILLLALVSAGLGDQWVAGPPAYKTNDVMLDPSVVVTEDSVTLNNRGILVSKNEYPKGVTLSFDWKWTEGKEEGNYQDQLCVALATDGKQRPWPSEIEQGYVIRFNPAGRNVAAGHFTANQPDAKVLELKDGFPFMRNTIYRIRIVHEGKFLTVMVDGKEAIKVELPDGKGSKLAIYNRECVAGIAKQSVITKLKIE